MTNRNYQQEFNDEMLKWQQETPFPVNELPLPPNFENIVKDAFYFATPALLKLTTADFKRIVNSEGDFLTLLDMGTILFVLESRTANDYGWEMPEYLEYIDMVSILTQTWRKTCEVKRDTLKVKYDGMIAEEKRKIEEARNEELLKNSGDYKKAKNIPLGANGGDIVEETIPAHELDAE